MIRRINTNWLEFLACAHCDQLSSPLKPQAESNWISIEIPETDHYDIICFLPEYIECEVPIEDNDDEIDHIQTRIQRLPYEDPQLIEHLQAITDSWNQCLKTLLKRQPP